MSNDSYDKSDVYHEVKEELQKEHKKEVTRKVEEALRESHREAEREHESLMDEVLGLQDTMAEVRVGERDMLGLLRECQEQIELMCEHVEISPELNHLRYKLTRKLQMEV